MPYVVTQPCCADASCVVACPVNCIHPAPGEPGFGTSEMVYIDPRSCVGCGACVTACPVEAIKPDTALTPAEQPFAALNAAYYDAFPHADRAPLHVVAPQRRLASSQPRRVAIVGAGPAGLYVADELLKHPEVSVDVLDRLPTPYGLVRAGVAPDHQHTKRATDLFGAIERERGFSYLLGVEVGRDVTLAELEERYDAVVYAVGAAADRPLGIPGEDLDGSLSATDLVGWYNGHPDKQDLAVALDHPRAVVVGNGNVALDVARILTADPDALSATDVARLPWAQLAASAVREVVVLGRRGPEQAAFTMPELIGLVALSRAGRLNVVVEAGDAPLGDDARGDLLAELRDRPREPHLRTLVLRFLAAPVRLVPDASGARVGAVEIARTRLEADGEGVRAVATGETEVLETGLVLRSVGYRGLPVADLPHDERTGTVPNDHGRVRPGVYVAGWVKRGPSGFIGSNKACAQDTVTALLDDADAGLLPAPAVKGDLAAELRERGVDVVDRDDWHALDAEERRRGASAGRPRTKIVDRAEMTRVVADARRGSGYAAQRRRRRPFDRS
ncbi:FAD-dependent oxidoreductase [Nocardioides sp. TRM66260-LWL]|uniref:FAD-dependent oxidoreductase n=1 Tax=Nocardioides sp. TRM66260-LWL TaxID=2874478 RepID=UPI001CC81515|nr:FAD-dependent oxidoreductase [Nocardioides sp. TRM66260-LWL]MBZ5733795.1 FAD-dependent oxidoreductase [Nocardioides sp. TRM66260-LWL]